MVDIGPANMVPLDEDDEEYALLKACQAGQTCGLLTCMSATGSI